MRPRIGNFLWLSVFLSMLLVLGAAWLGFTGLGRTPGELIDYLERRLEGHPRLETVAHPLLDTARDVLAQPPKKSERLARPFPVPTLAPLVGEAVRPVPGQTSEGTILRVGPGEAYATIAAAARQARDGDTVLIKAGEYQADVTTWKQKRLTVRGVGGQARLNPLGRSAEVKATWVIRNGQFLIENIDFIGAKAGDRNGAGIRFEGGHLILRNCRFHGNQNGLLATGGRNSILEIEHSEFGYNGQGDGLTHNLYVGEITSLSVTGSYFHHANVGHLIKSRAARNVIAYNRITDETGGRASYELEFPNGGIAHIIGNVIQQNRDGENSTLIAYGMEGLKWPDNRLTLIHNTLVNEAPLGGAFLRVASPDVRVRSANNLWVGPGKYHVPGTLESVNDLRADWDHFKAPARYDYRLEAAGLSLKAVPPDFPAAPGVEPTPSREYVHPREHRPLPGAPRYPGALQGD